MTPDAHRYKWVALSNTTIGMLMATINSSIVLIALPDIFRGIHLDPLEPGNSGYLLWMLMPDGRLPEPGGWNRIHFVVDDIGAEVDRLRAAGLSFRNEILSGPGGRQILLDDPSGNPIELFQPAGG